MIVGTAGHIDHGKTSLVRALTGIDTDRLEEEKARGITIDLGFAYIPLPDGGMLGFVDVPGHERLVHTMIAGAASINLALLVVAADDGVMPQTREHLQILLLLGIDKGFVALTKTDLVEQDRVAEVERQIASVLAATPLAGALVVPVSSTTGAGIDTLKSLLLDEAANEQRAATDKAFRLAVDRSFSLTGAGTIVTGSVVAGEVKVGDEVQLIPYGRPARLRSLHAMNRAAERGVEGDRCALNLRGTAIHHDNIRRGDWAVAPSHSGVSDRCDVLLTLLDSERKPVRHWTPVQLHFGAGQTDARVVLLESDVLDPGKTGLTQLVLREPQPLRYRDALVLRDTSAQRTIAGAHVLDPAAPDRHRRRPERLDFLRALTVKPSSEALRQVLALPPFLLSRTILSRDWGLTAHSVDKLVADLVQLPGGADVYLASAQGLESLIAALAAGLRTCHEREPILPGVSAEALRLSLPLRLPKPQFQALLAHAIQSRAVVSENSLLRAPQHQARVSEEVQRVHTRLRELLSEQRFRPPRVADLAKAIGVPAPVVKNTCKQLARAGMIVEVAPDVFFLRSALREMAHVAAALSAETGGAFTAAQFRDRLGNGRQLAIQILDYLDRRGITLRKGDTRRLGKEPDGVLGSVSSSW